LTELGPDVSEQGILFDIGVGSPYVQFCIRTDDEELPAALRAVAGRYVFDYDNPVLMNILVITAARDYIHTWTDRSYGAIRV